jgi:hypothetical protein
MEIRQSYNEEQEYYYVSKYKNIIESNGPHDAQMVIHNTDRQVSYFDMEPILLVLSNINNDYTGDNRSDIYTFYGMINSFNYRITINLKSSLLEFINTDINVSQDFQTVEIPEVKYPIYQYTSNPAIVITAALVAGCYVAFVDSNNIINSIDYLSDKINDDEDYYIDESIILILSLSQHKVWHLQKDIINIISNKIEEKTEVLADLKMQKIQDTENNSINALYSNLSTSIKSVKKILLTYVDLKEMIKTLKPTDEVLELKLGKYSYFLVRRHNKIMTIKRDEFNTIQLEKISEYLQKLYDDISIKFIEVMNDFNDFNANTSKKYNKTAKNIT